MDSGPPSLKQVCFYLDDWCIHTLLSSSGSPFFFYMNNLIERWFIKLVQALQAPSPGSGRRVEHALLFLLFSDLSVTKKTAD